MEITDKIRITNEDNMELMARYPDKHFDLAIVDPPYGIGFGEFNRTNKDTATGKRVKANKYKNSKWDDSTPNDEYFIELKRVSKNQIVWGGNYFIQLAGTETPNLKKVEDFIKYIQKSDSSWCFGINKIQYPILQTVSLLGHLFLLILSLILNILAI